MSLLVVSLVTAEEDPKYPGVVVRSVSLVLAVGGAKPRPLVSASRTASKLSNALEFVRMNCS